MEILEDQEKNQPEKTEKEEENEEEREETEEERKTRRTTLQEAIMKPTKKKADFLPNSIDIRLLEGNLYLEERPKKNLKELVKMQNDARLMEKLLRNTSNRVNAYCENFILKAGLLMKIMCDLFLQYKHQLKKFKDSYSIVRSSFLRYLKFGQGEFKEGSEVEELDKEMDTLYKKLNHDYKFFLGNIVKLEDRIASDYKKLLSNHNYKDTLNKIEINRKSFSVIFSKTMRWIHENEDIFRNFDANRNLFLIENRICSYMKIFRIYFDKKVIYSIYGIIKELEEMVKTYHKNSREDLERFDQLGKELFTHWELEDNLYEKEGFFDRRESKLINFYETISPGYQKYMKKKLKMSEKSKLRNEDFLDFFEYYDIKYCVESPLIVSYIKVETISLKNENSVPAVLCLDVFGSLSLLFKKIETNGLLSEVFSVGLFIPCTRALLKLDTKERILNLNYSPDYDISSVKAKKKFVKMKRVDLKINEQDENVDTLFLKCFYKVKKNRDVVNEAMSKIKKKKKKNKR